METCEVVVVGSGPTGLMLAAELKLAGIDVVVLDRNPGRHGESRAVHMQPRAAEEMQLRGLFAGMNERAVVTLDSGYMAGVPYPLRYETWPTRIPNMVRIPQPRVEQLLEEHLNGLGIEVRYHNTVTGLTQDEHGVTVEVAGVDGDHYIRASYLVGADGGSSTVRKLAGIAFPGTDATSWGVVGDITLSKIPEELASLHRPAVDIYGTLKPNARFVMLIPLGASGRFRCAWMDPDPAAKPEHSLVPVTREEYEEVLLERYDGEVEIDELIWAGRYTNANRQAENYRAGRVLLAGDAAHIHLPASSQGMGLGLQDAMNLGWKLAAHVRGHAPHTILDSFHTERHAATKRVLENIKVQGLLTSPATTVEVPAVRDLLVSLLEIPEVNHQISGLLSNLDIRHPVIGYQPGVSHGLLGARMPDVEVTLNHPDGPRTSWLSDLFHTGHMVLITTPGSTHADTAAPWLDLIDIVEVDALPLPGDPADALLVRPDGYIAWTSPDGGDLTTALATWLTATAAPQPAQA
ncbi:FAD-dependent monooxygenase [Nocardia sp. NPDC050408]|uniref:FAD-dependent monooxygenase n=1 Tax=Nocardia sp. NPDC050408 TaxID=3364319 RepID=UPI0037BA885F